MLILAFVSLELSNLAGFKLHNTVHDKDAIQRDLGRQAVLEYGICKVKLEPEKYFTLPKTWASECYKYAGFDYKLKIMASDLAGYTEDCVIITASASGSTESIGIGMRYPVKKLMISDLGNQRIRRVNLGTKIITTVAGTGLKEYSGDNGPATAASLGDPHQTAMNSKSELLIASAKNNVIRKINSGGIITTVAGTGNATFTGDNGPAIIATFSGIKGVAVDSSDNLYIADTNNNRIRRLDAITGIITTYAGTGLTSYNEVEENNRAVDANLNEPSAISFDDAGNLYIADTNNNCIRMVDTGTPPMITTVAGTPKVSRGYDGDGIATSKKLNNPGAIVFNLKTRNLYIADTNNHCIRMVDTGNPRMITTVAGMQTATFPKIKGGYNGEGTATSATLNTPGGICLNDDGDLFIADTENHRIRKVVWDTDTGVGVIETVAGNGSAGPIGDGGPAKDAELKTPSRVTWIDKIMDVVPEIYPPPEP